MNIVSHGYDVEADVLKATRLIVLQVAHGREDKSFLLPSCDVNLRRSPVIAGTEFDFDKQEVLPILSNEIYFAPARTKVACEELNTLSF